VNFDAAAEHYIHTKLDELEAQASERLGDAGAVARSDRWGLNRRQVQCRYRRAARRTGVVLVTWFLDGRPVSRAELVEAVRP
jgi:hypothetical protein